MRLSGRIVCGRRSDGDCARPIAVVRVPHFSSRGEAARRSARLTCSRNGGLRCAPTALRCSPRGRGAELTSFAALTAFKQRRRVSSRSALRAPTTGLRSSAPLSEPARRTARHAEPVAARETTTATAASAKALAGRLRRASGAPSSAGQSERSADRSSEALQTARKPLCRSARRMNDDAMPTTATGRKPPRLHPPRRGTPI
jgi:hypothetical protein